MSAAELKAALGDTTSNADEHVALLDVRPAIQFGMCAIPGSFSAHAIVRVSVLTGGRRCAQGAPRGALRRGAAVGW